MSNALRDGLRRGASASGNIDWADVLVGAYRDREARAFLEAIPSGERRRLLGLLGLSVYQKNLGNYRLELLHNVKSVEALVDDSRLLWERHAMSFFAFLGDMLDFSSPAAEREHMARTQVDVHGFAAFRAHAGKSGVVLLNVFQSHIGFARRAVRGYGKIALIRKTQDGVAGSDVSALFGAMAEDVVEVPATPLGAVRLLKHLRNLGLVGVYNDFLYPDALGEEGYLFGRPVLVSAALPRIVKKARAVVIPMAVARTFPVEANHVEVHFFPPLESSLSPQASSEALLIEMSLATECLIRRFPAQWRLWNTLQGRWRRAAEMAS